MPTIYDVAKRAKVSTYTVSVVLNRSAYVSPELTKRVMDAVQELDYTINSLARGLQTKRTETIGMLIPDIANPFYAKVVGGVEDVCKQHLYSLILGNTHDQPEEQSRYLNVFRAKQIDGLLVFCAPNSREELERLVRKGVPLVFIARAPAGRLADSVSANNRSGMRLLMNHLIGRGHKRIAIITGPLSLDANKQRRDAWRRAMRSAGLDAPDEFARAGDTTAEFAHQCANSLLAIENCRPTAIFAASFLMLTGVLRSLLDRGLRCPEDIEVVSSDDSEWLDIFQPPVSTIVQPSYEMGIQAAQLLMRRIADPKGPREQIVMEPGLKIRVPRPDPTAKPG